MFEAEGDQADGQAPRERLGQLPEPVGGRRALNIQRYLPRGRPSPGRSPDSPRSLRMAASTSPFSAAGCGTAALLVAAHQCGVVRLDKEDTTLPTALHSSMSPGICSNSSPKYPAAPDVHDQDHTIGLRPDPRSPSRPASSCGGRLSMQKYPGVLESLQRVGLPGPGETGNNDEPPFDPLPGSSSDSPTSLVHPDTPRTVLRYGIHIAIRE